MGFFKQVEGEAAVVVENGVYRQVDVYTRDGVLYAKSAGGFVKLYADGSTTKAKLRLETLSWDGDLFRGALGHLLVEPRDGAKAIDAPARQKLLGAS